MRVRPDRVEISPVDTETPPPVVGRVGRTANPEEGLAVLGQAGAPGLLGGHHGVLLTPGLVAAAARH